MKTEDKQLLLREIIEMWVFMGYDITPLIGRPLAYFNWNTMQDIHKNAMIEMKKMK